jgi:acyl carrier protein
MTVRALITTQMQSVASQQNKSLAPLNDNLVLLDCGLDSLCFAILVARLEDELGYDPFSTDDDVYFPTTFGDFVAFYERAAR